MESHQNKSSRAFAKNAKKGQAIPQTSDPLSESGISLYVHIPYCVHKCRYCDFNSWATPNPQLAELVDHLLLEAELSAADLKPQTVFFGGGTPSILPPEELHRLLDGLHQICGFRDSAVEVSIEANPESFSKDFAEVALGGGINRMSIGVQSLRQHVLEAYERIHSPQQALNAINIAKEVGFKKISADLIYAFPTQNVLEWFEDLQQVIDTEITHLSCYELSFEEGTALTKMRDKGKFPCADMDFCAELFETTRNFCAKNGFKRYEVSNFSKAYEECLHNLVYWRSLQWVGIGPGATTWRNNLRSSGPQDPEQWKQSVIGNNKMRQNEEWSAEHILFDCFMMGLRLEYEGVSLDRAKRITGLDPKQVYAEQFDLLLADGLIEFFDNSVRASPRGFRLLDTVLKPLLPSYRL